MGAVSKATPFYARREVEVGDYVVMVSDGISDCFTSNRELGQWMLGIHQQDPSVDLMSQRILKAVSYTHLDVYKRQQWGIHIVRLCLRQVAALKIASFIGKMRSFLSLKKCLRAS